MSLPKDGAVPPKPQPKPSTSVPKVSVAATKATKKK